MTKQKIYKNHTTNRTFEYKQGSVSLKFTLEIDTKNQLKDFKKCLEEALGDVEKTIEGID